MYAAPSLTSERCTAAGCPLALNTDAPPLQTFLLLSWPWYYCHLSIQACVCRNGTAENSLQKLHLILQLCLELGIYTSPAKLGGLCIYPLLSWHHSSWDTEPDIQGVPHVSALSIADYGACSWPQAGPGMHSEHNCSAWTAIVCLFSGN